RQFHVVAGSLIPGVEPANVLQDGFLRCGRVVGDGLAHEVLVLHQVRSDHFGPVVYPLLAGFLGLVVGRFGFVLPRGCGQLAGVAAHDWPPSRAASMASAFAKSSRGQNQSSLMMWPMAST